jgi:hypothetical protein
MEGTDEKLQAALKAAPKIELIPKTKENLESELDSLINSITTSTLGVSQRGWGENTHIGNIYQKYTFMSHSSNA